MSSKAWRDMDRSKTWEVLKSSFIDPADPNLRNRLKRSAVKEKKIFMCSCIGIEMDSELIPYFFEYYTKLGINSFLIVLHIYEKSEETKKKLKRIKVLLDKYSIEHLELWYGFFEDSIKTDKLNELKNKYAEKEDWILFSDIDEFQEYPRSLKDFFKQCDKKGINAIRGSFVDRVSKDGLLKKIDPEQDLETQFPNRCNLTGAISKGCCKKHFAVKKIFDVSNGFHSLKHGEDVEIKYYPKWLNVNHYKWRYGLLEKIEFKLETRHNTCIQTELKRFVEHYNNFGRIRYEDYPIEKIDLSQSLNTYIKKMEKGLCTLREYKYIKDNIVAKCPINLLVFGAGNDSELLVKSNLYGKTVFLETNRKWIKKIEEKYSRLDIRKVEYDTSSSQWEDLIKNPHKFQMLKLDKDIIDIKWDMFFIDGPRGWVQGRSQSFYTTAELIKTGGREVDVFVHDFNRRAERNLTFNFWKKDCIVKRIDKLVHLKISKSMENDISSSWKKVCEEYNDKNPKVEIKNIPFHLENT